MVEFLFNKVAGLEACNFIKKRLQHLVFFCKMYEAFKSTFFYRIPPEAASGRCFWIRPLFVDRATSGAYQSLVLEMKETEIKKKIGFVCMSPNRFDHLLGLIRPMILKMNAVAVPISPDEHNSMMMNDFHHLLRTLARFTNVLSKW